MGEIYIEDYIWLIGIGVFVFFVIVGFVADKTGLARKTFQKTSPGNSKKSNSDEQSEVAQVVPAFNMDNDVEPVTSLLDSKIPVEAITNEDLEQQDDNLYLSDDDIYDSKSEDSSNDINELYLNNEKAEDNIDMLSDSNDFNEAKSEDGLYQPLGDIAFDAKKIEESHMEMIPEEDVWNFDDSEKKEENNDTLILPDLDELNAETEEDVWKF